VVIKTLALMGIWDLPVALLDLIFPPICVVCGTDLKNEGDQQSMQWAGQGMCRECIEGIPWLRPPYCPMCAKPISSAVVPSHPCSECLLEPPPFESARALMIYREEIFPIIHRMKYGARPSLARFFGEVMLREFERVLGDMEVDGIIPIPLHPRRLRQRGFNQAALMAKRIGRRLGIQVEERAFARTRWTEPQVGLSRARREVNVRGAFKVRQPEKIQDRQWLLVDDVYTTGSTLREAARTLKKAGAATVQVLTLARVL
jgi:ComF family protein